MAAEQVAVNVPEARGGGGGGGTPIYTLVPAKTGVKNV